MINKNCKIEKFENPFPYIKIQNFLEKDFYENLEFAFPKIDDFKTMDQCIIIDSAASETQTLKGSETDHQMELDIISDLDLTLPTI